jgi:phosphoglycerate dehydrogenase-like enzyme
MAARKLASSVSFSSPLFALAGQMYAIANADPKESAIRVFRAWSRNTVSLGHTQSKLPMLEDLATPTTIGFVGLGAMGFRMANSGSRSTKCTDQVLRSKSFNIKAYDVWAPSAEAYRTAGGYVTDSLESCARDAQVLVLMVVNAKQASDVLFTKGALDGESYTWDKLTQLYHKKQ